MKEKLLEYLKKYFLEYFTIFIGMIGQVAHYVQAYKIFSLHSSYAVSLSAALIGFLSMICWLAYGLARNIKPLIFSNIFGLVGITVLIAGIWYYK